MFQTISALRPHARNGSPKAEPSQPQARVEAPIGWRETYQGGSAYAERREFQRLAKLMMQAQVKSKQAHGRQAVERAFHAKSVAALRAAELQFVDDLPPDLQAGYAKPGARYPVTVRFSNAGATPQPDKRKDFRGVALRVYDDQQREHDLLLTNYPVSHARDARQFVLFAHAMAGGTASRVLGIAQLCAVFGPAETIRMLTNVLAGRSVPDSLALETYWSRGALCWGEQAVRMLLRPSADTERPAPPDTTNPDFLAKEFADRLRQADITFELCLQRYRDPTHTPIEDTAVEWREEIAPPIKVASVRLPQMNLATSEAQLNARTIEEMAFNPWNTTEDFRPLGNLNRARKNVYDASAAHRRGQRFEQETPLRNRVATAVLEPAFDAINRVVPWHQLPTPLSLLNLDIFRGVLRRDNLIDTRIEEAPPAARPAPRPAPTESQIYRTFDGQDNDLSDRKMGSVGATFGRNMPPITQLTPELIEEPNPVIVSRELMYRKEFLPARSLNLLAAAWIQFQVHDWVTHARHKLGENNGAHDVVVPLPAGTPPWANRPDGRATREMRIGGNRALTSANTSELFGNESSHWWDASQVYGASADKAQQLREGAKLILEDGHLPAVASGGALTGFNESWWLGLSLMHTLFAREHNLLCDELRARNASWSDERIYQTARLIVSALIAKFHTVEWTPAILATDALHTAMNLNWFGPRPSDWLTRLGLWLTDVHALKGIPETLPDHHAAPYSLTEEFVTVYRMHPLIPDDYVFCSSATGERTKNLSFNEIQGSAAETAMRDIGMNDGLYSFGIAHPGAITLHNFPRSLQSFVREGERIDLSVVDLVRTRRRGVPRYNAFRKALHKQPVRDFSEMTSSPESNRILKEVYGDPDKVDTVVGLLGETPPNGFGFSDTAFRIFILMASRRLQSDRFLTVDFRPEIYTAFGLDWIAQNSMTSVILRHCPELAATLPREASAFAPWSPVRSA